MATSKNTTKKTTGKNTTKNTKAKQNVKGASKSAPAPSQPAYVPTEKDIKLKNEIKLLIALAVTALIFISNFGLLSPLGDYISMFMFGVFGFISYALPIIAFLGIAFLISNIKNPKAVIKFIAGVVFVLLVAALIQIIFNGYNENKSMFDYYTICGKGKSGGGFIGAMIVNGLCSTVGMVGAYIIILLLIIIALVIMTERSFISGVKKGSNKVYTQAKEGVTELKDNVVSRVNEKEYEKNKRIHKKVKGVSMQKISDGEESDEDIHEITGEFAGKLPENAHLYRGHVDVDKYAAPVNEEVEEEEIKEVRIETRHTVSMPERKVESSNLHNETKGDEPQLDEDGLFKPKERIVVSEEAKTVMNRKPFSGATVSNTQSAGAGLLSSSSTQNEKLENEVSRPKKKVKDFILPSTNLLNRGNGRSTGTNELELRDTAKKLENILANFGITAEVVDYSRGPSVTRYEIQPEIGTRLANITKLADDIKLHLAATDIRIEPIPGKSTIGIEVPNEGRDSVLIRELIESNELKNNPSKLAFAAGKDIAGQVIVGDIAKMPH